MDGICYDAAGDVLEDGPCPVPGINDQYAYDSEGKLIYSGGGSVTYIYDAEGNRIAKTSSGTVTNVYFYDTAGHMTLETNGAISVLRSEMYAGNRHLLTQQGGSTYYSHANWLGTQAARSDVNGNICETISSAPFGDAQQSAGSCSPSNLFFTGKERDTESGNDYFGARYYGSSMGRFMSPDPSGLAYADPTNPQSFNLYSYAQNNPLTNVDPTGLDCVYFNDAGTGVDGPNGIDHNSNSGECGANGGDWVNGTTSASQVQYHSGSDNFTINSSDAANSYTTIASAPGSQVSGIPCYGNCAQAYIPGADADSLNPTAQAIFSQVGQQTGFIAKAGNCLPGSAATGIASYVGLPGNPNISPGTALRAARSTAKGALTLGAAERAGAAAGQAAKVLGPAVAEAAGELAAKTVGKAVPFIAAAQGIYAVGKAQSYFSSCYATE
jgi:RHS repeat-associated protein